MEKKSRSQAKKTRAKQQREAGMEDPNKHKCLFCDCIVPNTEGTLDVHYTGKKHKRLEKLHLYAPFFQEEGLIQTPGAKTFQCTCCDKVGFPADVQKLKAHLLDVHFITSRKDHGNLLPQLDLWKGGSEPVQVVQGQQKNRPKVYWAKEFNLQEECRNFEEVKSPTLCTDSMGSTFYFLLINARFSSTLLSSMTELATFLEAKGNATRRGEMKRSERDSRIVTFGYRYAYGEIGRFKHKVQGCYSRADVLCSLITMHLKEQFPLVFDHLEGILQQEGIGEDKVRLGNSPFTSMSVTRDYDCNSHVDADDASYGFFVWFGAHGTRDKHGNEVHFHMPGVQLFTIPCIGDVLLCKAKDLIHCTKTVGSRGQFGIALYQKSSFFRWYSIMKANMSSAVHNKLVNSWLQSLEIEY